MAAIEPELRAIIGDLLEPIVDAGGGDICEEFTYRLPGYVFAEFFNLTPELGLRSARRRAVRERRAGLGARTSGARASQLYDIARRSSTCVGGAPRSGRRPGDGPARGAPRRRPLAKRWCSGRSGSSSSSGWSRRASSSDRWCPPRRAPRAPGRAARRPLAVPAAVEEYLRLLTPYRGFARTATRDVEIRGRLIRKDEPVGARLRVGQPRRDVFPEPERFVLDRPNINQPPRLRDGAPPLRGRPARDADAAGDLEELLARTSSIELAGEADDGLARVGDAFGPGAACPGLTSTRSTRRSSPTPTPRGRGCGANAPSRTARAGTSSR